MKKSLLLICIALCFVACQSEMDSVNPVNQWGKVKSYPSQKANDVLLLQNSLIIADNASTSVFYTGADNGLTWNSISSSFGSVASLITYGGGLYCGTTNGVYYSGDLCKNWVQKNTGLPADFNVVNLVATDIGLFVCGSGLFYSRDKGDTWQDISIQGITQVLSVVYLDHTLIASTNAGLFQSLDTGKTWLPLISSSGISNASITRFEVFNNGIFACSGIAANSEVYASFDKGKNWIKSSGLAVLGPNSFTDFEFYNGTLYVASTHGVFESVDNGRNWVYSGCDNALSLLKQGKTLYAGTASQGLWSTVMQEVY